jgi:hypothetical protein
MIKRPKQLKIVRNQPQPVGVPSKDEIARLIAEHASTEAKTLEAAIVAYLRAGVPFEAIEVVHESAMGEVETEEGHRLKLVSRAYVRVKPGFDSKMNPSVVLAISLAARGYRLCPLCNVEHREHDPCGTSQLDDFLNRHRDD